MQNFIQFQAWAETNVNFLYRVRAPLNNIGPEVSEEKSFEMLNIFPIQMNGAHINA